MVAVEKGCGYSRVEEKMRKAVEKVLLSQTSSATSKMHLSFKDSSTATLKRLYNLLRS